MPHGSPLPRERAWLAGGALAALACAAFARAIPGELVLDDLAFLVANPRLDGVSSPLVFFGARVWDFSNVAGADVPLYRPVFMLALWAGHAAFGGQAAAWHVAVLLLHAANVLLVWRLARRLAPAAPLAAFSAAALFAVHPVHAEAVAWILAFVHPLATLLALLAAHATLAHARADRPARLAAACLLSGAAMLTSEGALAVPPILVALDAVASRRLRPTVAAAHALSLLAVVLLRAGVAGASVPVAASAPGLAAAADFLASYLRHLVVPWPQHVYLTLPRGGVSGPFAWSVAASAVAASAWIVARAPAGERAVPSLAVGAVWLSLLPLAVGAMNPRPLFAPRALYLPSVGVALAVAWLLRGAGSLSPRATRWARAGVALAAAAGLAASDAAALEWRTNARVYARAVEADPGSPALRVKLAELLAARGDVAGAEEQLRTAAAVATAPAERAGALEALGAHLATGGRLDEAERALRDAVAAAPSRSPAWVGLGNVAYLRGDLARARDHYERAVGLDGRNFEAATNLALVYEAIGDREAARRHRAIAESLRPREGGSR